MEICHGQWRTACISRGLRAEVQLMLFHLRKETYTGSCSNLRVQLRTRNCTNEKYACIFNSRKYLVVLVAFYF